MWLEKIWDLSKNALLLFLIIIGVQTLVSVLITWAFRFSGAPVEIFSFRIFGKSIKAFRLRTSFFDLNIGNIQFGIGRKFGLILQDVSVELHGTKGEDVRDTSSTKSSPSFLNGDKMQFTIGGGLLIVLKWILPFRMYARNLVIKKSGRDDLNVELASMAIGKFSDKKLSAEVFLHEATHLGSGANVHHIGYEFKAKISQSRDESTGKTLVDLQDWSSNLRISGVYIRVPKLLDPYAADGNKINEDPSSDGLETVLERLAALIKEVRAPIQAVKVIDIKIENTVIEYEDIAVITVSNLQFLLESVSVYSYGMNLEFLPSKKYLHRDIQLSVTANSVVAEADNVTIVRIPLINAIIATDCISKLFRGDPLSKSKILNTFNVIDPTAIVTMDQLLAVLSFINGCKAAKADKIGTQVDEEDNYEDADDDSADLEYSDTAVDEANNFQMQKERTIRMLKQKLGILPSIILEFNISNFSATLQLSERDNLIFKIYNVQFLGYRQNEKMTFIPDSTINDTYSRPELAYLERDPFVENLTNYLKIVGATWTFFSIPDDGGYNALSIPICGFDRYDSFMDDITDFKFNIHGTLRHFSFTLDSFDVINKMNEALIRLLLAKQEGDKIQLKIPKGEQRTPKGPSFVLDWSLKMRFKDVSFSLLLAGFLSRHLDPVELSGLNLSDFGRGCILLVNEAFLNMEPKQKDCHILNSSLIRIIEDPRGQQLTDVIVKFKDMKFTTNWNKEAILILPFIRFKMDINLIWFVFLVRSVFDYYFLRFKRNRGAPEGRVQSKPLKKSHKFDLKLGKIIIELTLPQNTPLLLSFTDTSFSSENRALKVSTFSALVKSVYVKKIDVHIQLVTIRDFEIDLSGIQRKSFGITTSEVHFNTEYHFRFYVILDNVISFFKAIKQIHLAFKNLTYFHKLYPSQMVPKEIPSIRFFTKKFCIEVKDDPFEQELGLIFKIGVLEQRERLEKLKEFELLKKNYLPPSYGSQIDDDHETSWVRKARQKLLENFSTSWIGRYREARVSFYGMPSRIVKHHDFEGIYFLFTENVGSKVAVLNVENVDISLGQPSFPLDKYADFVYHYGKKVPKDTAYTLLLISHLAIKTDLWELRVRDYPLPAISFPNTCTEGDIVLGEQMPDDNSLRTVYVPFVPAADTVEHRAVDSIYGTHIIRTLNSVKLYFNIKSSVHSTIPATITWGKSLQPGYESLMLWFDFLTRPKDDPSPKIGFWDKFRFLFHGRWIYEFSDISGIQLNIKGSENPYKIADDGAGLTFFWAGGTVLRLHDTSDPRDFLVIESKKFQLAVRDFTEPNKFDKVYMNLDGEVVWKLGLVFEEGDMQEPGECPRSFPSRPHYDISLRNPLCAGDLRDYDAYRGFRSAFIHMSLGVYSSRKDSVNCLYLAPHAVAHFLDWWNLFHTYTSGPIRQGPLFNTLEPNTAKFGRSLFTVKYQLSLAPLVFTHAYRHYSDLGEGRNISFTGLKGKLKTLKIDLHQKRVKLLHTNEKLKKSKEIWSFKMSKCEIDCIEADIRILTALFVQSDLEEETVPKVAKETEGFSSGQGQESASVGSSELKDAAWFDLEDYIDLDQVTLESTQPLHLEAIPLMYSPRISYFRKINDSGYLVKYPFGGENSHKCLMGKNHSESTQKHLALGRHKEIGEEIKLITSQLEKIAGQGDNSKTYHTQYEYLSQKLHKAKHRLFIIENILNDLRNSAKVPDTIHDDDDGEASKLSRSRSQYSHFDEENNYWSDPALIRLQTIETFRTMRRESNLQMDSSYDNRFFVHNIQFKVNKKVRHSLIEYFTSAFERKSMQFFLTYKSVNLLNELLNTAIPNADSFMNQDTPDPDTMISNSEFMERFEHIIREVPNEIFDYLDSYLIRLISPQLQVMSENEPNVAALLTARDIEVGIIDVIQALDGSGDRMVMDVNTIVETRICVISKDIQVFTLLKNDILANRGEGLYKNGYGVIDKAKLWPPWIPMEVCFDGSLLEEHVFLRRKSMFFMYTIPNPLFFTDKEIPGLSSSPTFRIGFPGLIITSTSQQYCAIYNIVEDLLDFGASLEEKVAKLANVMLAEEVKYNLQKLDTSVVTNLQRRVKEQYYTREFLKLHNVSTFRKSSKILTLEIRTTLLELFIIMTAIKKNYDNLVKGHKTGKRRLEWRVSADELIWQMFDDKKKPFTTIVLSSSTFVRYEALDGTNTNIVSLSSVHVFNQQEKPTYVEIVVPFNTHPRYMKDVPMVEISWKLGPPVGGIGDLQKMVVNLQPIRFKIDHITSEKLLNYLFPKNDRNVASTNTAVPSNAPANSSSGRLKRGINEIPLRHTAMATVLDMHGNLRSHSPVSDLPGNVSINSSAGSDGDSLESATSPSESEASSIGKKASKKLATQLFNQPDENINEMVKRSGTFFNVGSVHIQKMIMSVCYKGSHHLFTDVDNLTVRVPYLHYENKLWSRDEFLAALRKDITRVVLGHLGNIIGNKFIPHKKENKLKASMDISQLLHWDSGEREISKSGLKLSPVASSPSFQVSGDSIQEEPIDEEVGIEPFSGQE
ncbi:hypothetical protein ZYGR_0AI05410 [Zygosaccharomyces rouxii]|uniref:Protein FMP27, mitochondrial n=1 Tax=Zygosaccharomyces rouxii TaxID=4956 RepID=A0A1Q3AC02_ZYGRO|nr:hypothetical protein ZYGR_0AI05410 [Zygosaccharomyces rouxii]